MEATAWSFGPAPKKRRSKILGAVVGFVAAASITAVAVWFTMPDSPGFGYGRAKNPAMGLQLVSVVLTGGQIQGNPIGPSETGLITTQWHNPNGFSVSVTELSVPAGSSIERVGDPTCVAGPSTFSVPTLTFIVGDKTIGPAEDRVMAAPITTGADFPSCLAGGEFRVPVLAKASLTTP
jgi:hypothetical protein